MENVQKYPQETTTPRPRIVDTLSTLRSNDFKESLTSLFFCTLGNMLTGTVLGLSTGHLESLPALIILIPPAIAMRGNIFSTLGSRLGTYLHTGQITPRLEGKILRHNVAASFVLTVVMSITLGLMAAVTARAVGMRADVVDLVVISLVAGLISAVFMLGLTIVIAFFAYRHGWDPDNVTTPLITLAGDMITLPLLFLVAGLVLDMGGLLRWILFAAFMGLGAVSLVIPFIKKARPYTRRIVLESTPMLLLGGLLDIFSGSILGDSLEGLVGIAGVFIMIPAFLEDGGAIGGILAAKFSSALHLGSMRSTSLPSPEARHLFVAMHLIGLMVFSLIGGMAYAISTYLGISTLSLFEMVAVAVITGEILVLVVNLVAYYASILSFNMGLDPDNTTIPIITSFMDLMGTATLIAVLVVAGLV